VGIYFQLDKKEMNAIIDKVRSAAAEWRKIAGEIGTARADAYGSGISDLKDCGLLLISDSRDDIPKDKWMRCRST
jgi:hypothetical protein